MSRRRPPNRTRWTLLGLMLGAALVAVAAGCVVPPVTRVSTVVSGLDHPWDLAFLPNGNMVFTERAGRVDLWTGTVKRVLATPADVRVAGEGGMLGLAVDPQF